MLKFTVIPAAAMPIPNPSACSSGNVMQYYALNESIRKKIHTNLTAFGACCNGGDALPSGNTSNAMWCAIYASNIQFINSKYFITVTCIQKRYMCRGATPTCTVLAARGACCNSAYALPPCSAALALIRSRVHHMLVFVTAATFH
jgi:hypothetical protein